MSPSTCYSANCWSIQCRTHVFYHSNRLPDDDEPLDSAPAVHSPPSTFHSEHFVFPKWAQFLRRVLRRVHRGWVRCPVDGIFVQHILRLKYDEFDFDSISPKTNGIVLTNRFRQFQHRQCDHQSISLFGQNTYFVHLGLYRALQRRLPFVHVMRSLSQLLRTHRLVVIDHLICVIRCVARNMFVSIVKCWTDSIRNLICAMCLGISWEKKKTRHWCAACNLRWFSSKMSLLRCFHSATLKRVME